MMVDDNQIQSDEPVAHEEEGHADGVYVDK